MRGGTCWGLEARWAALRSEHSSWVCWAGSAQRSAAPGDLLSWQHMQYRVPI